MKFACIFIVKSFQCTILHIISMYFSKALKQQQRERIKLVNWNHWIEASSLWSVDNFISIVYCVGVQEILNKN